jgi:hypothetical protein
MPTGEPIGELPPPPAPKHAGRLKAKLTKKNTNSFLETNLWGNAMVSSTCPLTQLSPVSPHELPGEPFFTFNYKRSPKKGLQKAEKPRI